VGTRADGVNKSGGHLVWINGPEFLKERGLEVRPPCEVTVKRVVANANLLTSDSENNCGLDRLIEVSPGLYTFRKRDWHGLSYCV